MRCCFKTCAAVLLVAMLAAGCRVQREVQAHTVAATDSAAVNRAETSERLYVKEWKEGVMEQLEVEFFPPAADSVRAEKQSVPVVKRIIRTTIHTQNDREAEGLRERVETDSVQVRTACESILVQSRRSRPAAGPWLLLGVLIAGSVVLVWKYFRI